MEPFARFSAGLKILLGRPPGPGEIEAFSGYLSLLLKWNRIYSLTAYRKPADVLEKLFLDSLLFLPLLPPPASDLLDFGSGIGIPGLPLKIVEPRYRTTVVEAKRRRTSFLNAVVRELGLRDVRVLTGRAEALLGQVPGLKGGFDVVVTRAPGPLRKVLPVALRFLRPGGRFIASGPPAGRPGRGVQAGGSWKTLKSPLSGLERRFFVFEKTF